MFFSFLFSIDYSKNLVDFIKFLYNDVKKGGRNERFIKTGFAKSPWFVNGHEDSIPEKSDPLIARLEEALAKKTAVHIILLSQVLQAILSSMILTANKLSLKISPKTSAVLFECRIFEE